MVALGWRLLTVIHPAGQRAGSDADHNVGQSFSPVVHQRQLRPGNLLHVLLQHLGPRADRLVRGAANHDRRRRLPVLRQHQLVTSQTGRDRQIGETRIVRFGFRRYQPVQGREVCHGQDCIDYRLEPHTCHRSSLSAHFLVLLC